MNARTSRLLNRIATLTNTSAKVLKREWNHTSPKNRAKLRVEMLQQLAITSV